MRDNGVRNSPVRRLCKSVWETPGGIVYGLCSSRLEVKRSSNVRD
jgi:hypothetical protein